jgi:hypothetical protein
MVEKMNLHTRLQLWKIFVFGFVYCMSVQCILLIYTHRRCLRHVINLSYLFLFFSSQSPQHQTVLSIPAGTSFVNKSTRTTMIETVQKVYFGDENEPASDVQYT